VFQARSFRFCSLLPLSVAFLALTNRSTGVAVHCILRMAMLAAFLQTCPLPRIRSHQSVVDIDNLTLYIYIVNQQGNANGSTHQTDPTQ
jgi:hypothetical protein